MITLDDIAAARDNFWAVLGFATVVGILGAWFILAAADYLWVHFCSPVPAPPADRTDDVKAALDHLRARREANRG